MKAFTPTGISIEGARSLLHNNMPSPTPGLKELLVEVGPVSVNPLFTKVQVGTFAKESKILGWGASGIVREVGPEVTLFQPGDEVFYFCAGSIARTGGYSQFHLVDERIIGHKPRSLSATDAAALPWSSITAWELLFDRLGITQDSGRMNIC
jgi:NADPH:quinone reductase-like Zn-dependent oxidoreductase